MNNIPEYIKTKNDNYLNFLKLKETIQNFLADFKNAAAKDRDIDLWKWCWDAIDLLEEVLENK